MKWLALAVVLFIAVVAAFGGRVHRWLTGPKKPRPPVQSERTDPDGSHRTW